MTLKEALKIIVQMVDEQITENGSKEENDALDIVKELIADIQSDAEVDE